MINSYKDLKIGFIGAGKVGFSLGKLFCENGIHVTGYYNWHVEAAKEAAISSLVSSRTLASGSTAAAWLMTTS